ncbi:MAG: hypothetical protein ACI31F_07730 [Muribaculaceae bacterium]
MKKVLLGAISVLALASCSNEKVVELSQDQEIKFTVEAGKATSRAADGYCNNAKPKNFKVWARHKAGSASTYTSYFANKQYDRPESGSVYTQNDGTKR